MPKIEINMDAVDEDAAKEVADEMEFYCEELEGDGVAIIEMIVGLGFVMEVLIDKHNRKMANARIH